MTHVSPLELTPLFDSVGPDSHEPEHLFCAFWMPNSEKVTSNYIKFLKSTPPPLPCNSYALVQATAGVGTVLIWDLM